LFASDTPFFKKAYRNSGLGQEKRRCHTGNTTTDNANIRSVRHSRSGMNLIEGGYPALESALVFGHLYPPSVDLSRAPL
jgi:hypothetical protein